MQLGTEISAQNVNVKVRKRDKCKIIKAQGPLVQSLSPKGTEADNKIQKVHCSLVVNL